MFQSQTAFCPPRFAGVCRAPAAPALPGRRVLAACAAAAFVAAVAILPQQFAPRAIPEAGLGSFIMHADTTTGLRDRAEALRAQLLRQPGVAAVNINGLRQQRLAVEYAPRVLASYGITPAELAASLPVDPAQTRPGHLAVRTDAAGLDSPQDVANLPVRAGARVFRLGDVAMVSRARLDPPVAVMRVQGQPAALMEIVQSR